MFNRKNFFSISATSPDENTGNTLQAENQRIKKSIQQNYSFYFLAKDVADFCNTDYWAIMEKSAIEIFSLVEVMKAKGELLKIN